MLKPQAASDVASALETAGTGSERATTGSDSEARGPDRDDSESELPRPAAASG